MAASASFKTQSWGRRWGIHFSALCFTGRWVAQQITQPAWVTVCLASLILDSWLRLRADFNTYSFPPCACTLAQITVHSLLLRGLGKKDSCSCWPKQDLQVCSSCFCALLARPQWCETKGHGENSPQGCLLQNEQSSVMLCLLSGKGDLGLWMSGSDFEKSEWHHSLSSQFQINCLENKADVKWAVCPVELAMHAWVVQCNIWTQLSTERALISVADINPWLNWFFKHCRSSPHLGCQKPLKDPTKAGTKHR